MSEWGTQPKFEVDYLWVYYVKNRKTNIMIHANAVEFYIGQKVISFLKQQL